MGDFRRKRCARWLQLSTAADPHRRSRFPVSPTDGVESVEHFPTLFQLAEYHVLARDFGQLSLAVCEDDEKLRRVRVLAGIGHRQRAAGEFLLEARFVVVELATIDRLEYGCASDGHKVDATHISSEDV